MFFAWAITILKGIWSHFVPSRMKKKFNSRDQISNVLTKSDVKWNYVYISGLKDVYVHVPGLIHYSTHDYPALVTRNQSTQSPEASNVQSNPRDLNTPKGPFTQKLPAISLRFSAICQCIPPVHVYFAEESSASSKVRLLHKDTMFRESHLNRGNKLPQIAPNRSCGLYVRFWGCNFGLTNIALSWCEKKHLCKRALNKVGKT